MVNYSISRVKNREKNTYLYFARPQFDETCSTDELAEIIGTQTTVSEADVKAVLVALSKNIPVILRQGRQIDLEGVAKVRLALSSNCTATPQEFTAQNIYSARPVFVANKKMKELINGTQFRFVPSRKNQTTAKSADKEELDLTLGNNNDEKA